MQAAGTEGRASWEEPAGPTGHELTSGCSRGSLGWWGNLIDGTAMAGVLGGQGGRWQIAGPVLNNSRKKPKQGQQNRPGKAGMASLRQPAHQALALPLPETAVQSIFEPDPAPGSVNGTHVSLGERLSHRWALGRATQATPIFLSRACFFFPYVLCHGGGGVR